MATQCVERCVLQSKLVTFDYSDGSSDGHISDGHHDGDQMNFFYPIVALVESQLRLLSSMLHPLSFEKINRTIQLNHLNDLIKWTIEANRFPMVLEKQSADTQIDCQPFRFAWHLFVLRKSSWTVAECSEDCWRYLMKWHLSICHLAMPRACRSVVTHY